MFVTTETYDVWWLISILRRRTRLLLVVMTVIPILTALYVSALPKQYSASSRLQRVGGAAWTTRSGPGAAALISPDSDSSLVTK